MSGRDRFYMPAMVGLILLTLGLETKGEEMSYGEVREFLSKYTNVVELSNSRGARVAVCPQWQGRVMTSSCAGEEGASFGFVNRDFIEKGQLDERFNNYGAEDRMWLSARRRSLQPLVCTGRRTEPGPLVHTASDMNSGAYETSGTADSSSCRMTRQMKLQNASGTKFDLAVTRGSPPAR